MYSWGTSAACLYMLIDTGCTGTFNAKFGCRVWNDSWGGWNWFSATYHSPSSWGNSSHTMAVDVLNPVKTDTVKEAPIARPSMKLWSASLRVIIHATVLMLRMRWPRNQRHMTSGTSMSWKSGRTSYTYTATTNAWLCFDSECERQHVATSHTFTVRGKYVLFQF